MEKLMNIFSSNLKILRKNNNETQEQLAEAIGSTRQTIGFYESGDCKDGATLSFVCAVAEHYNVSALSLLDENSNLLTGNESITHH